LNKPFEGEALLRCLDAALKDNSCG